MGKEDVIAQGGLVRYQELARWLTNMVSRLDGCGVGFAGFSVKAKEDELLMVLRGKAETGPVVAFVYGDTLDGLFRKAEARASRDALRWREDQYQSTAAR